MKYCCLIIEQFINFILYIQDYIIIIYTRRLNVNPSVCVPLNGKLFAFRLMEN